MVRQNLWWIRKQDCREDSILILNIFENRHSLFSMPCCFLSTWIPGPRSFLLRLYLASSYWVLPRCYSLYQMLYMLPSFNYHDPMRQAPWLCLFYKHGNWYWERSSHLLKVIEQVNTDPGVQLTTIWVHSHATNHWASLPPHETTASWLLLYFLFLSCSFASKLIAFGNSMMYKPVSFHFYF